MYAELRNRVKKIYRVKNRCLGILLYNEQRWSNANFFWLSNFESPGWLWFPFGGKPRIFAHPMYCAKSKSWVKTESVSSFDEISKALPDAVRIGVDKNSMSSALLEKVRREKRGAKFTDVSKDISAARAIKTTYEIKQIIEACKMTGKIFGTVGHNQKSEAMLKADIDWEIQSRGFEPAFPTIVASGKGISEPHHIPSMRMLGKTVLVDVGIRHNGYCSDITRTFNSRYENIIGRVFEAVEPMLTSGVKVSEIDKTARSVLGNHEKNFTTSLGHGIGIDVHETPTISSKSKQTLRVGNVVTIEPGIYVPDGIRKENMYLITKRGAKNLTDF